ncbi:recombinase family protein [Frankia sp. QA3]|uniref:recombinase family protein n=1 Tax=Frankia sp. QA3 TaxID=710111 RepID=UPI000269B8B0|nr:recombinase family protein [Frankia sp. QA3]EIV90813.1 site-specific recombinase, DNA invertase Pin [Frankia sp. QA3]
MDGVKRALGYGRRSVLDARQGKSVGEQEAVYRADCDEHGWQAAAYYVDDGVSASRYARGTREGWPDLLSALRAGKGDLLWLWDASRGGRELEAWANFLTLCRTLGILVYVSTHGRTYDMVRPVDWETLAYDGVRSTADSDKKSLDVRRGMHGSAKAGRPHGPVTYGYRRVYGDRRQLVAQEPDPMASTAVKLIINGLAHGKPSNAIIRELEGLNIPSPKGGSWGHSTIRSVATNEAYLGRRLYNGTRYDAMWPALVDESAFYAAQRTINQKRDEKGRYGRPNAVRHLLSYLAECDVCKKHLRAMKMRGHYYYSCPTRQAATVLGTVEEYVTRLAVARLAREDIAATLLRPDDTAMLDARREVEVLKARLTDASTAYAKGRLTIDRLGEVEAELLPQLDAAQKRAETVALPLAIRGLVMDARGDEKLIRQRWDDDLTIVARRDILRVLFEYIRLRPANGARAPRGVFDPDRLDHRWRGQT